MAGEFDTIRMITYLMKECFQKKLEIKKVENCIEISDNILIFREKIHELIEENKVLEDFSSEQLDKLTKLCVYKFNKINEFCNENKIDIKDADKYYETSKNHQEFMLRLIMLVNNKIKK